jgi:serine/threonine protein kinase
MLGTDPKEICGFRLYESIGEGGHARVRLAFNDHTQTIAAIKILPKHSKDRKIDLNIVRKEVLIHSTVSHLNIITLHGSTEDSVNLYLILEYAAGRGSLQLHAELHLM